ncbi:MAG: biotin/lipoyl-binding protein, partial [Pseudomonadota bacterium]|nr:biotin/lipoyl-binding protein [Pseudomonadota bacterium]
MGVLTKRRATAMCLPLSLILGMLGGCSSEASDDNAPKPVAAIQTALAGSGGMIEQAPLYGIAEPSGGDDAAVTVPMEATVSRLLVTNGSRVGAGQAIAALSASPASQLDLAKAGVDAATTAAALA